MRQIVITILTLGALIAPASRSEAQMLPERIRAIISERVEMRAVRYQQGREEQTSRETRTVKIGADGELSLSNISGDIVVTRANGSDATIEIVKTARARTADEARELLALVNVTVTERAGRAEVKTVYPQGDEMRRNNRRNVNVSVNYTVAAPAGTRLTISSISGSIRVSDIKGDISANSISGTVRVANGGRIAAAKSMPTIRLAPCAASAMSAVPVQTSINVSRPVSCRVRMARIRHRRSMPALSRWFSRS